MRVTLTLETDEGENSVGMNIDPSIPHEDLMRMHFEPACVALIVHGLKNGDPFGTTLFNAAPGVSAQVKHGEA